MAGSFFSTSKANMELQKSSGHPRRARDSRASPGYEALFRFPSGAECPTDVSHDLEANGLTADSCSLQTPMAQARKDSTCIGSLPSIGVQQSLAMFLCADFADTVN